MKIERFWLVTVPQAESVLEDLLFETDAKGLALQFRGGLKEEDIHALYTDKAGAEQEAKRILAAFKRYASELESPAAGNGQG